jgi:hypothetical protein
VNIVKRFQLHFALDVALDPLQLGSVMRSLWKSIGHKFWKQRHNEEHLSNFFPVDCLHPSMLQHDLYNSYHHNQIMESTFVLEDSQIWSDFQEYNSGTYPKQNQSTHGFDFIPKPGSRFSFLEKSPRQGTFRLGKGINCRLAQEFRGMSPKELEGFRSLIVVKIHEAQILLG